MATGGVSAEERTVQPEASAEGSQAGSLRQPVARLRDWWNDYWFEAVPPRRLDLLVRIVLVVLVYTVLDHDRWVLDHGWAPEAFYRPTALARWMGLPAPTTTSIAVVQWTVVLSAVIALFRRPARLSCAAVFASYTVWVLWSFGWSKVDHDRLTMWVALLVFSLVPRRGTEAPRATGWALRVIQVVFALSYPLSAFSKLDKAGWYWPDSYVFTMAIVRRGTAIGQRLLEYPELLKISQWGFIIFEIAALLLLVRHPKVRTPVLVGIFFLHFFTWLAISIHFLPHSIFLLAFLPLERWIPGPREEPRDATGGDRSAVATESADADRSGTTEPIRS